MATLLDIRKRLVEEAGRYDLAVDPENGNYADSAVPGHSGTAVINDAITYLNELRYDITNYIDGGAALLVLETDTNLWTNLYPELLLDACRMILEKRHRNNQGVADWDAKIEPQVAILYSNAVQRQIDTAIAAGSTTITRYMLS